jgi:hypothetical protein
LTNKDIHIIFDESTERINRYIPKSGIPIIHANRLDEIGVDNVVIVIFAWNYTNMIIHKLKKYGFKFVIPFPMVKLVNSDYINENTL